MNIKVKQFHSVRLMNAEMNQIKGGGFSEWRIVPVEGDPDFTVEQKYTWWGKKATKHLRRD